MTINSYRKQFGLIALFSLMITLISPIYAEPVSNTPNEAQIAEAIQDTLEGLLKGFLGSLHRTDSALEGLALDVNNDTIRPPHKEELIQNIAELRGILTQIKNDAFVQVDPIGLYMIGQFITAVINHLIKAIDNGFNELPSFDMAQIDTQHLENITLEMLQTNLQEATKRVEILEKKATSAGLSWKNKTVRAFDKYVVQPVDKYYLLPIVIATSAAAITATYIGWKNNLLPFNIETKEIPVGSTPTKVAKNWLFGYPMQAFNGIVVNKPDLNICGEIDAFLYEQAHGIYPFMPYIVAGGGLGAFATLKSNAWKKTKDFTQAAYNRAKGGAYHKKADKIQAYIPKYNFNDVVGAEHAKKVLSLVVKYMEDPERFDRAKIQPEKGYLLTGPTRTGKSFIAEALAGEIYAMFKRNGKSTDNFGFYTIKASLILQKGIGFILDLARRAAPCVLFIDEIDLLGLQRADGDRALLAEFLQSMSGVMDSDPKKQVIIIAATNRPENMEWALRQRGRFGKEIRFEYPIFKYRKEYLVKRLESLAVNVEALDIDKLSQETEGCSYEDIDAMIKSAFQKAKIRGEVLNQAYLEHCLDEEVRNIIFEDSYELAPYKRQLIATHQAGHALAHVWFDVPESLAKVTVRPVTNKQTEEFVMEQYYKNAKKEQQTIEYGKIFSYHRHDTIKLETRHERLGQIKQLLAGHVAVEIIMPDHVGSRYHTAENKPDDIKTAFDLALDIVLGDLDIKLLSKQKQGEMRDAAYDLLEECKEEVRTVFAEKQTVLAAVSHALAELRDLNHDDITLIINHIQGTKSVQNLVKQINQIADGRAIALPPIIEWLLAYDNNQPTK